jgi:hypothetical protein
VDADGIDDDAGTVHAATCRHLGHVRGSHRRRGLGVDTDGRHAAIGSITEHHNFV